MSLFTQLRAYHNFYGFLSKSLAESPKKHRDLTRATTSTSHWFVHYNPATKMFKTWNYDGQVSGITTDLSDKEVVKHSSKRCADKMANHPNNKPRYVGFIAVEVIEKTTFELA